MTLLVLLAGCGPSVAPSENGDGTGTGTDTESATSSSSSAGPISDDSTGEGLDSSSGAPPPPTQWCWEEHLLEDYSSNFSMRMVDLGGAAPPVLWRQPSPIAAPRHWATRLDAYGGSETLVFDIDVPASTWLQFGDIDGDGLTDGIDEGSPLQWFRGHPELGLVTDPEPLSLPANLRIRMITDFDGDGLADVVLGNNVYTDFTTAVGDGTGTFTEVDAHNFDPRGGYQISDVYPIDGGWTWFLLEHELCDSCPGHAVVLASIGADGTIGEHQRIEGVNMGVLVGSEDHDGDGVLDVLVTLWDAEAERTDLVWLDSSPEGVYEATTVVTDLPPSRALDVDGDHVLELLVADAPEGPVLLRWDGATLGPPEPILGLSVGTTSLEHGKGHGDLDGDGYADFLAWVLDMGDFGTVIGDKVWTLRPCDGA